jgi:hypothetical protein
MYWPEIVLGPGNTAEPSNATPESLVKMEIRVDAVAELNSTPPSQLQEKQQSQDMLPDHSHLATSYETESYSYEILFQAIRFFSRIKACCGRQGVIQCHFRRVWSMWRSGLDAVAELNSTPPRQLETRKATESGNAA